MDIKQFFQKLFVNVPSDYYINLRCLGKNQPILTRFYELNDLDNLVNYVDNIKDRYNVYFGVQPRYKKDGTEDGIDKGYCLFLDIDTKEYDLSQLRHQPSLIVDSGNGYHCYYILEEPVEDLSKLKQINKTLVHLENADKKSFDNAKILRIPETFNHKDEHNLKTVEVISESNNQINFNDLYDELKDELVEVTNVHEVDLDLTQTSRIRNIKDVKRRVPKRIVNRMIVCPSYMINEHGNESDYSRNDFFLTIALYQFGFNDSDVNNIYKICAGEDYDYGLRLKRDKTIDQIQNYLFRPAKSQAGKTNKELLDMLSVDPDDNEAIDEMVRRIALFQDNRLESTFRKVTKINKTDLNTMMRDFDTDIDSCRFFINNGKLNRDNIYQIILEHIPYIKLNNNLFLYKNGIYSYNATLLETLIENMVQNLPLWTTEKERKELKDFNTLVQVDSKELDEMAKYILRKRIEDDDLATMPFPHLFCCNNGMVNPLDNEKLEFDCKYKRVIKYNVDYNPKAKSNIVTDFYIILYFTIIKII